MLNRFALLLVVFVFLFLSACAGSKGGGSSGGSYGDDDEGEVRAPKANELKEARNEATSLTEENHKMAREIFELKNKLGLPTDE